MGVDRRVVVPPVDRGGVDPELAGGLLDGGAAVQRATATARLDELGPSLRYSTTRVTKTTRNTPTTTSEPTTSEPTPTAAGPDGGGSA